MDPLRIRTCQTLLSITSAQQKVFPVGPTSIYPVPPPTTTLLCPSLPGIFFWALLIREPTDSQPLHCWSLYFHLILSPLSPTDLPDLPPCIPAPTRSTHSDVAELLSTKPGMVTSPPFWHFAGPILENLRQATLHKAPMKPTRKIPDPDWKGRRSRELQEKLQVERDSWSEP